MDRSGCPGFSVCICPLHLPFLVYICPSVSRVVCCCITSSDPCRACSTMIQRLPCKAGLCNIKTLCVICVRGCVSLRHCVIRREGCVTLCDAHMSNPHSLRVPWDVRCALLHGVCAHLVCSTFINHLTPPPPALISTLSVETLDTLVWEFVVGCECLWSLSGVICRSRMSETTCRNDQRIAQGPKPGLLPFCWCKSLPVCNVSGDWMSGDWWSGSEWHTAQLDGIVVVVGDGDVQINTRSVGSCRPSVM